MGNRTGSRLEPGDRVEWVTKVSVGLRVSLSKKVAQDMDLDAGDFMEFIKKKDGTWQVKKVD